MRRVGGSAWVPGFGVRGADAGATAIEFVALLPVLLLLLMGIVESGFYFYVQTSVAGAAREAVRSYAINYASGSGAIATARAIASTNVPDSDLLVGVDFSPCSAGGQATVTVTYQYRTLTGWLDFALTSTPTVVGIGTMRCSG